MTQITSELPQGPDHVAAVEVSPKFTIVRTLGYLAAWVGVISVCALPYGFLSLSHGTWNAVADKADVQSALLALFLVALFGVSLLGIAGGVAAGAGKPWSRTSLMLYADLTLVLAIVGVLPVYFCILRTPVLDIGIRHAMELIVVLKLWIVEIPLAIAILYNFTRPALKWAFEHPEPEAPDRSRK